MEEFYYRTSKNDLIDSLFGYYIFISLQVYQDIYPIATYSNFASLILVFLLTDFLRYKPVIILSGLCAMSTYILLIWGQSLFIIRIVEIFYGIFISMEVAYYTYIYTKVDKKSYHLVSSLSRMAILSGRCLCSSIAQWLTSYHLLDYHQLNYLTLIGIQ